jgi:hypothetical protein
MPALKSYTTIHLNTYASDRNIIRKNNQFNENLKNLVLPDSNFHRINYFIQNHLAQEDSTNLFTWHLN